MKKKVVRSSVELMPGQSDKIQQVAFELGYIQKRGVGAGKIGSVSQLMQAIADGKVEVKHLQTGKIARAEVPSEASRFESEQST